MLKSARFIFLRLTFLCLASSILLSCGGSTNGGSALSDDSSNSPSPFSESPNILYVIMDDVGIDQMATFGYDADNQPALPNINAIARSGVRFRNMWSMPECSPGRASMFVGRYSFRTNVYQALGQYDLANSQISPYEMTMPKLLKNANYESGLFGKFHIAGPDNNPAGNGTPGALGWDYFYGWIGGLPASIDTTAGGVSTLTNQFYSCGFVPGAGTTGGANRGACYQANNSCQMITGDSPDGDVPGKQCLKSGGIFVPNVACQSTPPAALNFNMQNAYYVSPVVINTGTTVTSLPLTDSRNRGYRTTIEADAAISWIKSRKGDKPWMATVSFSAAHTPLQQAPNSLTPANARNADTLDCKSIPDQRVLQNQMTEAMDKEFGRILVETGLATRKVDGSISYDPRAKNTMIIIVGDNGTFGGSVKLPFNTNRAKGTTYQTGIWDPLIVAGPMVRGVDREVDHMVNMVDVYQLFGEMARINVPATVPRVIDSAPMLAYLTNPNQTSIRSFNFSQGGYNIQANGGRNAPCLIAPLNECSQIPVSKSVCEDNNGVWWGPGYTDSSVLVTPGHSPSQGYQSCCQVNQAKYLRGEGQITVLPEIATAIRNDKYKIVQNTVETYNSSTNTCSNVVSNEFYEVDQAAPLPKLDNADRNLLLQPLSASLQGIYDALLAKLNSVLASQPPCNGDGNIDGVVNGQDLSLWQMMVSWWTNSSVFDFNFDGLTNNTDAQIINGNQGTCAKPTATY